MWAANSSGSGAPSRARILQSLQERKRSRTNSLTGPNDGPVPGSGPTDVDPRSYAPASSSATHNASSVVRGSQQVHSFADPRLEMSRGPGPRSEGHMPRSGPAPHSHHPSPGRHGPIAAVQHGIPPRTSSPSAPGPRHGGVGGEMNRFAPPAEAGRSSPVHHRSSPVHNPAGQVQAPMPPISTANPYLGAQQQAALQHAHAQSSGFFIIQDSMFGNLILPVLPRVDNVK